jgi:hypothetical protein
MDSDDAHHSSVWELELRMGGLNVKDECHRKASEENRK